MKGILSDVDTYTISEVSSREELETYFRKDNIFLHLYEIGDLDDFFWPHTKWTALKNSVGITQFVALLYSATSLPVMLAMGTQTAGGIMLLEKMQEQGFLPAVFYSHLGVTLPDALYVKYKSDYHGRYLKMGLMDKTVASTVDVKNVERLLPSNLEQIQLFYVQSYPGNWFDERMLESLQTFGIWGADRCGEQGGGTTSGTAQKELIAVAGIHVFSKAYKVASLGNIAVHPAHRGKGLARIVTAALLKSLLGEGIEHVGLNVREDNAAAVACYTHLGFEKVGEYEEIMWNAIASTEL